MTSLGNIVYLVKCLSKPYLKHFFDCKMFIAATSFNPPEAIFKQSSENRQKNTFLHSKFFLFRLVHIMDQRELSRGEGPISLILVPTRELALQIYSEVKRYCRVYNIEVSNFLLWDTGSMKSYF